MDVRALRGADVSNSSLDGVIRPELPQLLSACIGMSACGATHRVNINDSLEALFRKTLNGNKEVASGT